MKLSLVKSATVFCLFGLSGAVFKLLATGGDSTSEAAPLWLNIVMAIIFITSISLIFTRLKDVFRLLIINKLLLAVLLYILSTSLWAFDKTSSLVAACQLIGPTLLGFFLMSRFSQKELLSMLTTTMIMIVIISFIMAIAMPEYGQDNEGNWRGAFLTKNLMAVRINIAFMTLVLAVKYLDSKLLCVVVATIATALVILSKSGTGIIILLLIIVSPVILKLLRLHKALVISTLVMLLCLGGLLSVFIDVQSLIDTTFKVLDKNPTLTGRTEAWSGALYQTSKDTPAISEISVDTLSAIGYSLSDYRSNHLMLGYGAQTLQLTPLGSVVASSADIKGSAPIDSAYMNILLKYGLIGSMLFALILIKGSIIAIQQLNSGTSILHSWYIVIMLVLLINGITESVDAAAIMWIFFAMIFASPYARDDGALKDSFAQITV